MLCATRKGAWEKKGLGVCVAVWLGVIPVVPGVSQRGVLLSCPCAQVERSFLARCAQPSGCWHRGTGRLEGFRRAKSHVCKGRKLIWVTKIKINDLETEFPSSSTKSCRFWCLPGCQQALRSLLGTVSVSCHLSHRLCLSSVFSVPLLCKPAPAPLCWQRVSPSCSFPKSNFSHPPTSLSGKSCPAEAAVGSLLWEIGLGVLQGEGGPSPATALRQVTEARALLLRSPCGCSSSCLISSFPASPFYPRRTDPVHAAPAPASRKL